MECTYQSNATAVSYRIQESAIHSLSRHLRGGEEVQVPKLSTLHVAGCIKATISIIGKKFIY